MQIIPHLAAPGRAGRAPARYQLRRHVFGEQQDFLCLRPHIGDACFPKETDNPLHFFFFFNFTLVVPMEDSAPNVFTSEQGWGKGKCNRSSPRAAVN